MAAARRRAISGGALIVFGGGLALYQMTSLVLGPAAESHQLWLSVSAPSVGMDDLSEPVLANLNMVIGTLAEPPAPPATVAAVSHHVANAPAPKPAPMTTRSVAVPSPEPASHSLPPGVLPLPSGIRVVGSSRD